MGYRRKRKLYDLDLTGTSLEGLTLIMKGLTVEESLNLALLQDMVKEPTKDQIKKTRDLFAMVAEKIERWDLEDDDGQPIPPSPVELLGWDFSDAMLVIDRWQEKVQEVPGPLEPKSNDGSKWVGPPIPMDIPLPNLPPSPTPN